MRKQLILSPHIDIINAYGRYLPKVRDMNALSGLYYYLLPLDIDLDKRGGICSVKNTSEIGIRIEYIVRRMKILGF